MSGLIFCVFAKTGSGADGGENHEYESGDLEPELVRHAGKRTEGCPDATQHRVASACVARLAGRDTGGDPNLLQRGDFSHGSILAVGGRTMGRNEVTGVCDLWGAGHGLRGGFVDPQLKQLMKELGEAINESLADSEQISEVVARIKEGGYDIFLVLEATIGVSKQGVPASDKTSLVSTLSGTSELKINDQDLKFLKSLRIKVEEQEEEVE